MVVVISWRAKWYVVISWRGIDLIFCGEGSSSCECSGMVMSELMSASDGVSLLDSVV